MTLEADQIVDRRRLRRKLSFWRAVGLIALACAIVGAYAIVFGRDSLPGFTSPQIARITIDGFIAEDRDRRRTL